MAGVGKAEGGGVTRLEQRGAAGMRSWRRRYGLCCQSRHGNVCSNEPHRPRHELS
jgi:hypothetical protein